MRSRTFAVAASVAALSFAALPLSQAAASTQHASLTAQHVDRPGDRSKDARGDRSRDLRHGDRSGDKRDR